MDLRHARAAKRRLRQRLAGHPDVQGVGVGGDPEHGYRVEVRMRTRVDPDLPTTIRVPQEPEETEEAAPEERDEAGERPVDVPVRYRVVGDIETQDPPEG